MKIADIPLAIALPSSIFDNPERLAVPFLNSFPTASPLVLHIDGVAVQYQPTDRAQKNFLKQSAGKVWIPAVVNGSRQFISQTLSDIDDPGVAPMSFPPTSVLFNLSRRELIKVWALKGADDWLDPMDKVERLINDYEPAAEIPIPGTQDWIFVRAETMASYYPGEIADYLFGGGPTPTMIHEGRI